MRSSSVRSVLLIATLALAAALGFSPAAGATVVNPVGVVVPFSPVEAQVFRGTVAQFANVGATGPAALTATVQWGDGTTSAATKIASPGSGDFVVDGAHTYARVGSYPVTVTLRFASNGVVAAEATATRSVTDAPFTAIPLEQDWRLNAPFRGPVASFTDPDPDPPADDFTAPDAAVIDWGDGTEGFGAIVRRGDGTFQVRGDHTWKTPGVFAVEALVNATAGPSAARAASAPGRRRHRRRAERRADVPYPSYEIPLPIENPETGEVTFLPPSRYFRAPVEVTLQVTDSTGQSRAVTRTVTFFDDGFRPTAGRPRPNCDGGASLLAKLATVRFSPAVGSKSGGFAARVGCVKIADCLVRVIVLPKHGTTPLGRAAGLVMAGTARNLTVRLTGPARRALARRGTLPVRVLVQAGAGLGRGTTTIRPAVLRLASGGRGLRGSCVRSTRSGPGWPDVRCGAAGGCSQRCGSWLQGSGGLLGPEQHHLV
jgi:hypothetical protein